MRASGCPRCILCVPQQVIAAARRTASGSAVAVLAFIHTPSYDTYRAVARR